MPSMLIKVLPLMALLPLMGTGNCEGETCEERVNESNAYINAALEENLNCTVDTDCTTITPNTDCRGTCPVPVAVEGVEEVEAAIDYANQTSCDTYIEDGCPYAIPD